MSLESADIQGVVIAAGIFACLAIIGQQLDKFLLPNQRTWLRDKAAEWWNFIDDLNVRNFLRDILYLFLKLKSFIFGTKIVSAKFIFVSLILSVAATFSVLLVGDYAYHGSFSKSINHTLSNHNISFLFPVNYLFDFFTLTLTVVIV